MKIGICTSPDKLPLLAELGYDYVEACFSWLIDLSEEAFREQTALVEKYAVPAEAYNIFFRGGMKLYSPDGNQDDLLREIAAYADKGFARASVWGGKIAVIGSGFVRGVPEGMTREETEPQFARVLQVCGDAAERYGMKIVVEPLSFGDCNYIHTVAEGAAAARLADHPAVGVLVDYFHHQKNGDDLEALPDFADLLYHVHYARPGDRFVPREEDRDALLHFASLLKKCPAAERVSLECNWGPDFDASVTAAKPMMDMFKKCFD